MYGFAIIAALRRQGYELGPAALYPFLHSLEATEYIAREERGVDEEVRKYHAIADAERAAPSEARGKIRELTGVVPEGRPP